MRTPSRVSDILPVGDLNVATTERWISAGIGGALAVAGIRRGGVAGGLLGAVGGLLLARGLTGHCPAYQVLERGEAGLPETTRAVLRDSAPHEVRSLGAAEVFAGPNAPAARPAERSAADDEADSRADLDSELSFPASDPPAYNPGRA